MDIEPNNNSSKLTPMTGYWCLKNGELSDYNQRVFTDLYLPLVGAEALAIYLLLIQKTTDKRIVTERSNHAELLSLLDIDLKSFQNARIKLEATGLIKNYRKYDELGEYYIYDLYLPLNPSDFFRDDLLSIFLYEKIGQSLFNNLVKKYSVNRDILNDAKDQTSKFLDVFRLNSEDLIDTPNDVSIAQNSMQSTPTKSIELNSQKNLDFDLIIDRASQLYRIEKEDINLNKDLIENLATFYDLDEIVIIDLLGRTMDIITNKIDPSQLKNMVQQRFEQRVNIQTNEVTETTSQLNSNFNRDDQLLIKQAKELAPAEFLASEKQKTGGFTGTVESRALRNLAMNTSLSPSVINILTHYSLQQNTTLSLPLMETIANDWQQNNIKTPEDALKRIQESRSKPRNPKRRYQNQISNNGRVEKGTDWSQVKARPVEQSNQDIQERLNRIRHKENN
ncbi:DnaD domain protein [Lactobacillus terrae]|uniref:DnaD domain protein n=1 Tax=Lactobacillus terrae TaxID=2269374 RepID=UPI000C1B6510|nr:DnaD domain protein [Lactobacillus terrae]